MKEMIKDLGYPSDSGRPNSLWLGGLAAFKEIARSTPFGPWGASAVSGGEAALPGTQIQCDGCRQRTEWQDWRALAR
jgi:hypothetical protein